jgi:hypothetical protein
MQSEADIKSGDNDALAHLIKSMPIVERQKHVVMPPQCAFNSYLWRPSPRQWLRLLFKSRKVRNGFWKSGHLLVHLAGWQPQQVCLSRELDHAYCLLNSPESYTKHS